MRRIGAVVVLLTLTACGGGSADDATPTTEAAVTADAGVESTIESACTQQLEAVAAGSTGSKYTHTVSDIQFPSSAIAGEGVGKVGDHSFWDVRVTYTVTPAEGSQFTQPESEDVVCRYQNADKRAEFISKEAAGWTDAPS